MEITGEGSRSRQAEPSDYSACLTPVKGEGDRIGQRFTLNYNEDPKMPIQ